MWGLRAAMGTTVPVCDGDAMPGASRHFSVQRARMWWQTTPTHAATSSTAGDDRRLLAAAPSDNQEAASRGDELTRKLAGHVEIESRGGAPSQVEPPSVGATGGSYQPVSNAASPGSQASELDHQQHLHSQQGHHQEGRLFHAVAPYVQQGEQQQVQQQQAQSSAVMAFVGGAATMTAPMASTTGSSATASSVGSFANLFTAATSYNRFYPQHHQQSLSSISTTASISAPPISSAQALSPANSAGMVASTMFPSKRRRSGAFVESASSLSPAALGSDLGKVPPHLRPDRIRRGVAPTAVATSIVSDVDTGSTDNRIASAPRSASTGSDVVEHNTSSSGGLLPSVFGTTGGLGTGTAAGSGSGQGSGGTMGGQWNISATPGDEDLEGQSTGMIPAAGVEQPPQMTLARLRLPPVSRLLGSVRAQGGGGGYTGRGSPPPPQSSQNPQHSSCMISPLGAENEQQQQQHKSQQQVWIGSDIPSPPQQQEQQQTPSETPFALSQQQHEYPGATGRSHHKHSSPEVYSSYSGRGAVPMGAGGRSQTEEAVVAPSGSPVSPDNVSNSAFMSEVNRKRPRSASPATEEGGISGVGGGSGAGVMSGSSCGGFDMWSQVHAPGYRRLGGCHAEGCGEPAAVIVPGATEGLSTPRYCQHHAGLFLASGTSPSQAMSPPSTLPPSSSASSSSSPATRPAATASGMPMSITTKKDEMFAPQTHQKNPRQQQQQQQLQDEHGRRPPAAQEVRFSASAGAVVGKETRPTSSEGDGESSGALFAGSTGTRDGGSGDGGASENLGERGSAGARRSSRRVGSIGGSTSGRGRAASGRGREVRAAEGASRKSENVAEKGGGLTRVDSAGSASSSGSGNTGARGGGRCEFPGCSTQPRYAPNGETRPRFCGVHKLPGQMNVVSRCCKHPDCSKVPHFGNDRQRPLYCGEHKLNGMVNVANRRCENPDCQRQPTYGNKGDKRPRFCSTHKHPGMHDVIARRCEHEGCMTRAAFNFHGQKTVKFCASHKLEGMQNLKSKCCEVDGCKKYRVYGFHGEPAVCCASHKREGMVDVRSSRCEFSDCFRHPSFGYKWEKKRRFCGRHKLANMIDVRSRNQPQKKGADSKGKVAGPAPQPVGASGQPSSRLPPGAPDVGTSMMPTTASSAGAESSLHGGAGAGVGMGVDVDGGARDVVSGRQASSPRQGAMVGSRGAGGSGTGSEMWMNLGMVGSARSSAAAAAAAAGAITNPAESGDRVRLGAGAGAMSVMPQHPQAYGSTHSQAGSPSAAVQGISPMTTASVPGVGGFHAPHGLTAGVGRLGEESPSSRDDEARRRLQHQGRRWTAAALGAAHDDRAGDARGSEGRNGAGIGVGFGENRTGGGGAGGGGGGGGGKSAR